MLDSLTAGRPWQHVMKVPAVGRAILSAAANPETFTSAMNVGDPEEAPTDHEDAVSGQRQVVAGLVPGEASGPPVEHQGGSDLSSLLAVAVGCNGVIDAIELPEDLPSSKGCAASSGGASPLVQPSPRSWAYGGECWLHGEAVVRYAYWIAPKFLYPACAQRTAVGNLSSFRPMPMPSGPCRLPTQPCVEPAQCMDPPWRPPPATPSLDSDSSAGSNP